MTDYQHDGMRHQWVHPESGTRIDCINMPAELTPDLDAVTQWVTDVAEINLTDWQARYLHHAATL